MACGRNANILQDLAIAAAYSQKHAFAKTRKAGSPAADQKSTIDTLSCPTLSHGCRDTQSCPTLSHGCRDTHSCPIISHVIFLDIYFQCIYIGSNIVGLTELDDLRKIMKDVFPERCNIPNFLYGRHFREAVDNFGVAALLSVCMEEMLHGIPKRQVMNIVILYLHLLCFLHLFLSCLLTFRLYHIYRLPEPVEDLYTWS